MDINGLRDFQQTLVVRGIAQGSVAGDKTVNVSFLGTVIKCRAGRGVSTAAGDVVIAMRQGFEIVVIDNLHAAAPSTDPSSIVSTYPPNPWASVQTGSTEIRPVETRSYRDSGGWRSDTADTLQGNWGGNNHKGCAFYGTGPRALGGVEVLSATIKVKRMKGTSWSTHEPTTLKHFTEKTRPRTNDVSFLSGAVDGPRLSQGESENFTIPTSWAQDLVDGTAGGLAIHTNTNDPKARLAGRGAWSPAWTISLTWRRVI